MSHDDETVVRRRLLRLTAQPPPGSVSVDPLPASPAAAVPGGPSAALVPGGLSAEQMSDSGADLLAGSNVDRLMRPAFADSRPLESGSTSPAGVVAGESSVPGGSESTAARRLPGPGAFDPGRRGVRALAAVAVLVVVAAGFWAWRSRPQAEPVPPVAGTTVPVADGVVEPMASPSAELVVAVAGKVRRPGLVRLPVGARLADAVEAAGGALPGVDVALLNPARKVADGELIVVGVTPPPAPAGQPVAGGAPAVGAGPAAGAPVNLNTATLADLDALPGVGPVLAQRILAHREQHGGFKSVGDLRQVDGIGDARYEQLKELVTV
ncbi:ComEA family DNA-binding protein [Micromonospora avicenniae]|uniref:Competence protein ComEA n=1 Tax=Micromonospora avicenniae TaxID=1198245 RepID=A0A1N7EBJ1_9ACTN|nr:ComEA family DNA-binding protein [Micromonospora avicenniae]SIR85434.1 competence protein ComEA [Micromonospora avicenniae]